MSDDSPIIQVRDYCFHYGGKQVLHDIDLDIPRHQVTALIGPSGSGKSTLLRSMNRMNDSIPGTSQEGDIRLMGQSLYHSGVEVISLRKRVGMVFQRSNPFSMSVFENVAFALRLTGRRPRRELEEVVEGALRQAALWDEVKDRLRESALQLSGGQQQRLCIARAIANQPEILLMDEPCAALDPLATLRIEQLILGLKRDFTIVMVTHNLEQASRCSDQTAFLLSGRMRECGRTLDMFDRPKQSDTEAYITGRIS